MSLDQTQFFVKCSRNLANVCYGYSREERNLLDYILYYCLDTTNTFTFNSRVIREYLEFREPNRSINPNTESAVRKIFNKLRKKDSGFIKNVEKKYEKSTEYMVNPELANRLKDAHYKDLILLWEIADSNRYQTVTEIKSRINSSLYKKSKPKGFDVKDFSSSDNETLLT